MDFGDIGQILLKMVAVFAVALIVVRLMGNRAVGQMSPFDFVLMVGIGDIVANVALDKNQTLLAGAEGLIGLLLLQQLLSRLSLKSEMMRKWFEGTPVVMVENGKILRENLVSSQFNYDDLRQELHKKGLDFSKIKDIKVARLESCGDFSVIINHDLQPLTRQDLDNFITSLAENPLSPAGAAITKLEKLMADMQVVTEYIKRQQTVSEKQHETWHETAKNLQ